MPGPVLALKQKTMVVAMIETGPQQKKVWRGKVQRTRKTSLKKKQKLSMYIYIYFSRNYFYYTKKSPPPPKKKIKEVLLFISDFT